MRVLGVEETRRRLSGLEAPLTEAAVQGVTEGADEVRRMARENLRPGRLAQSLSVEESGGDLARSVVAGASYARFVELGTRRMAARPFLLPALWRSERGLAARISAALARALRHYLRSGS